MPLDYARGKEAIIAKRGRKKKNPGLLETLDPTTTREISAVVLFVIALLVILSLFGAGGRVGILLRDTLIAIFGFIGFIMPIFIILWTVYLLAQEKFADRKRPLYGLLIALIILTGLIHPHGGAVGEGLHNVLSVSLGAAGAILVLAAALIAIILFSFNASIGRIWQKMSSDNGEHRIPGVKVNENTGVSVFQTIRRKVGNESGGPPQTVQVPVRSAASEHWEYPDIDLLELSKTKPTSGNIAKNVEAIKKTLDDFGIDVQMGDVNVGPTVTQYQFKPSEGVKLNAITSRADDLALALAAHPLRVEAPIPGKSAVGVEIPNKVPAVVTLREVLESEDFKKSKSCLTLGFGRDVSGTPLIRNLQSMPHLLIAGATGSGKSVAINAMLITLLYQNSPADMRLLLVDPKRVEFTPYNGIPHLMTPVVTEVDKTVNLLRWLVSEMDRRFKLFAEVGARNIDVYNENLKSYKPTEAGPAHDKMPFIVLVIDELADLMAQSANEVESAIVRLSQMARATGIHLVVATQRPSVDVITGLIKANITNRVAFAVASQVDSRTILDQSGAEKLLGNGDMLFVGGDIGKPKRVQGVIVTDPEIKAVTDFLKQHGQAVYDESIPEFRPVSSGGAGGGTGDDSLYDEAQQVVVNAGKASASLLQRRLKVGYARAARLLDLLEANGVVGPPDGAKPRDVLIDSIAASPNVSVDNTDYGPAEYAEPEQAPEAPAQKPEPAQQDDDDTPTHNFPTQY